MSMNFGPEWMRKIPNNYDTNSNQSIINNNHMGSFSKGKSMINDHSIGSKSNADKFKYSNEEVLALWSENKNKKIPFDYESNKNIAFTDPLTPMAMIPLNNIEKKIMAQSSVNSDISRSSRDNIERSDRDINHRDSRISRPFSYNRGGVSYDQVQNEKKENSIDTSKKSGNIWENQSRSNGFINNNNIYSLKDKNEKQTKFKQISNPIEKEINIENIQEKQMNKLNIKDTPIDLSNSLNKMSLNLNYESEKSPLNNPLFGNNIFSPFKSNSLTSSTKVKSFNNPVKSPIENKKIENTGILQSIFNEPDVVKIENLINDTIIEPPKWNYKDPTGKIQGPFHFEEMQEWYNAGYFEKTLPIKREHDSEFKSLSSMIEQYGEEKPFIIDAENCIKKEKESKLKKQEITETPIIPAAIKPIQKTSQPVTKSITPEVKVSSPLVTKSMSIPNYSINVGLGRGVGMKENSYNSNLDSVYNTFNNNSINSPKVYTRNSTFPNVTNQFDPIGYPGAGINNYSNPLANMPMMGIINNQPWIHSFNDPNMMGLNNNGSWNNMIGMQNQYKGFDSRQYMNPEIPKPNINQQYMNQQMLLQQQTQPIPPQYYQMMRQLPQNQIPTYNIFRQPMYPLGVEQPQMGAQSQNIGTMQNEIIPQISNAKPVIYDNKSNPINTSTTKEATNVWNLDAQSVVPNSNTNASENVNNLNPPVEIENDDNKETLSAKKEAWDEKLINNNDEVNNLVNDENSNNIPSEELKSENNEDEVDETENQNEEEKSNESNDDLMNEKSKNDETFEESEQQSEEIEDNNSNEQIENENDEIKESNEEEINEIEDDNNVNEEENENNEKEKVENEIEKDVKVTTKMPWNISANNQPQRLSLKEIQELEEKEKKEQMRQLKLKMEMEKKEKEEMADNNEESLPISAHTDTAWGSTPQSAIQKPTLRQIMAEEEINKKKQKDQQIKEAENKNNNKTTYVAVNTTKSVWGGRPLTIIGNSNSKVITSTLSSAKKESVSTPTSVRTSQSTPVTSATKLVSSASTSSNTSNKIDNEWTSVGKNTKKSEPSSTKINKSSSSSSDKNKGPSDAFLKWCKSALRVSISAGVNVDEFVNVLLCIPVNESSIIYDICTDTLGGITAIDPHKFAEEFLRRRKMDQNEQTFTSVRNYESSYHYDDNKNTNKFIPVKGKKKRGNIN